MALRIAICEDEPIELKQIHKKILEVFQQKEMQVEIAQYTNGALLLEDKNLSQYDAMFLDVDMPEMNGIELAEELREISSNIVIIFVTNRDDMVFTSIKFAPFRFVRKSNLDEELTEAVRALQHKVASDKIKLELPNSKANLTINIEEIVCFTSVKHDVYAVVDKKENKYLMQSTMKALEAAYASLGFIRIHASYIVNYRHVFSINRDGVRLENGDILPISRYRISEAREKLHFFVRKW